MNDLSNFAHTAHHARRVVSAGNVIEHQTMLINENRLNMADTRARQYLLKQVEKYFYGDGADGVQGYVPENQ